MNTNPEEESFYGIRRRVAEFYRTLQEKGSRGIDRAAEIYRRLRDGPALPAYIIDMDAADRGLDSRGTDITAALQTSRIPAIDAPTSEKVPFARLPIKAGETSAAKRNAENPYSEPIRVIREGKAMYRELMRRMDERAEVLTPEVMPDIRIRPLSTNDAARLDESLRVRLGRYQKPIDVTAVELDQRTKQGE